jgi:hypothetical protein
MGTSDATTCSDVALIRFAPVSVLGVDAGAPMLVMASSSLHGY